MQRHKVWREQWWEATSEGGLKGVRMPRYNVREGVMVGSHKCGRFKGSNGCKGTM